MKRKHLRIKQSKKNKVKHRRRARLFRFFNPITAPSEPVDGQQRVAASEKG